MIANWFSILSTASLASLAFAQSFTDCNPLEKTCPPNVALGTKVDFDFKAEGGDSKLWRQKGGKIDFTTSGAQFSIINKLDSPTLESLFYIFGGRVECVFRAAPGAGVISTVTLLSDDLDEIDIEMVGNDRNAWQSNYFGKGDTTTFNRGAFHPVKDATANYHNYTVIWTKEKIEWYVDGGIVRTLKPEDAVGGTRYPQTPMMVKLGVWPGGDPKNEPGVIQWAGGPIDYTKSPYTMSVKSLSVEDYSTGKEYTYSDKSGSWDSIKITQGKSVPYERVNRPRGIVGKWKALSQTVRIAIIVAVVSVLAIAILALTWVCVRQRKAGRAERTFDDAAFDHCQKTLNAPPPHSMGHRLE